ncbi:MAG: MarR family winged helix-turn-helix transcriptional regulator [Candidatus Acidiferrales bacterium]
MKSSSTKGGARNSRDTSPLPLSALLSQVLVAFTVEFDNEAEHQIPHWITDHSPRVGAWRQGLWLVSLAMYANCMQFIPQEGIRVIDLVRLARTKTNFRGMVHWGYITVRRDPSDARPKPPRREWIVRATEQGQNAQKIWRPLFAAIEKRWQTRFGRKEIERLRKALIALLNQIDLDLPDCLPILGFGLFSRAPGNFQRRPQTKRDEDVGRLPLSALLSRVLLAFAIEFERDSGLSLAICANVLRVLNEKGVRSRDLPLLSGVSKESISMALGILQKMELALVETDTASRTKMVYITPRGKKAQVAYRERLAAIEKNWQTRFGADAIDELRKSLEYLVFGSSTGKSSPDEAPAEPSPLVRGMETYPDNWRAKVPKPTTLPHFPMVLHRGGYPDGS